MDTTPDKPEDRQDKNPNKSFNGLVIVIFLALAMMFFIYRPEIPKIYCTPEIMKSKPSVVMLSTWWCHYCYKARKYFTKNNITYCEYDIENSAEGARLYKMVGVDATPILLIGNNYLIGFDENQVDTALSTNPDYVD